MFRSVRSCEDDGDDGFGVGVPCPHLTNVRPTHLDLTLSRTIDEDDGWESRNKRVQRSTCSPSCLVRPHTTPKDRTRRTKPRGVFASMTLYLHYNTDKATSIYAFLWLFYYMRITGLAQCSWCCVCYDSRSSRWIHQFLHFDIYNSWNRHAKRLHK